MHTQLVAQIRAHAHALVRMARTLPNAQAAELEALALSLLKNTHDFEVEHRRLELTESSVQTRL
jgi:hypothetical protein